MINLLYVLSLVEVLIIALVLILFIYERRLIREKPATLSTFSYYFTLFVLIFNPLTFAFMGAGMLVYICLVIYPILVIIALAFALMVRKTKRGKLSLLISTIMMIVSVIITLSFLFNPPYSP